MRHDSPPEIDNDNIFNVLFMKINYYIGTLTEKVRDDINFDIKENSADTIFVLNRLKEKVCTFSFIDVFINWYFKV